MALSLSNVKEKYIVIVSLCVIIILGFTVYGNSLKGEFLWDDKAFIKDNSYIKDWSKIIDIFTKNTGSGSSFEFYAYRPLQLFTYLVDYSLWKLNAVGYHITNTLLHVLVAFLLYWLIQLFYSNRGLSLLTALFFMIYPGHTEAVSYISGRGDLLSSLGMLLCFIFYTQLLNSKRRGLYFFMLLSYIAALLSKENTLILPLLLLAYHYAFKKKIAINLFLPIVIITGIYVVLRLAILSSLYHGVGLIAKRIPGFFVAIANYLRILLLPFDLHAEYGNKLFSFVEPRAIFGLVVTVLSLLYAAKIRNKNKLLSFSILWFFIALLPASSIYPVTAFYMAEHLLYFPSIGFFAIFAYSFITAYRIKKARPFVLGVLSFVVLFYSYSTMRQNNYWKDPISFYTRTLEYAPFSAHIHNNLGFEYSEAGKHKEAIVHFTKAIEINPKIAIAYYNLGRAYYNLGEEEKSKAAFKKAIAIDARYNAVLNDLASTFADNGEIDRAITLWNTLVESNPAFSTAHFNLAVFYYQQKRYDLAIMHCDKVISLGDQVDPQFLKLLAPYRK